MYNEINNLLLFIKFKKDIEINFRLCKEVKE